MILIVLRLFSFSPNLPVNSLTSSPFANNSFTILLNISDCVLPLFISISFRDDDDEEEDDDELKLVIFEGNSLLFSLNRCCRNG
jgi:hypothetical protein